MSTSPILAYTTLIQFSHRMALLQQQAGKDKLALQWLDFEAEVRHHSNNLGKVRHLDDNWTCDADIQNIVQELAPVPDRVLAPNRSLDEVFKKFGEEAKHAGWSRNDAPWLDEELNVVRKCLEALVTPPFVNGDESLPAPTAQTALFQLIDFIEGDASDFHRFGAFECRVILQEDGPKLHRGF